MLPELFDIGPIPIRAFGLTLALSFIIGVFYIQRMARRFGYTPEQLLTVAYILIFGGIIGARLGYVVFHWSEFSDNPLSMINPFGNGSFGIAGLNLYGGVLLGVGGAWAYLRWKKLAVLDVFDIFAPTLALGIGITRIGCFLNGCCFGTPTDLPWGVTFPQDSIPYHVFGDAHLHPAQIYSSAYGLLLFALLHWLLKHRSFVGQVTAVTFMTEALFRFAIELVRFYEDAMVFNFAGVEITYNQVISLALFILGGVIYLKQRGTPKSTSKASPAN